jgi:hypothetical protein
MNAFQNWFNEQNNPTPPPSQPLNTARSLVIESLVRAAFIDLNIRGYATNTPLQDEIAGPAAFRMAGYAALDLDELGEDGIIESNAEDKLEDGFEFDRFVMTASDTDPVYAVKFSELYNMIYLCIKNSYMLHRFIGTALKED